MKRKFLALFLASAIMCNGVPMNFNINTTYAETTNVVADGAETTNNVLLKEIPHSQMTATENTWANGSGGKDGRASNAIKDLADGTPDYQYLWHSYYAGGGGAQTPPYWMALDLNNSQSSENQLYAVKKVVVTHRGVNANKIIKYRLYATDVLTTPTDNDYKVITEGSFENKYIENPNITTTDAGQVKKIRFSEIVLPEAVQASHIKLEVVTHEGNEVAVSNVAIYEDENYGNPQIDVLKEKANTLLNNYNFSELTGVYATESFTNYTTARTNLLEGIGNNSITQLELIGLCNKFRFAIDNLVLSKASKIPHNKMAASANTEQNPAAGNDGPVSFLIEDKEDGTPNYTHLYHARYTGSVPANEIPIGSKPQKITLDLNKNVSEQQLYYVNGVHIVDRGNGNNRINGYEIQIATKSEGELTDADFITVKKGEFTSWTRLENISDTRYYNDVMFDVPLKASHVRIVSLNPGGNYTVLSNVEVYTTENASSINVQPYKEKLAEEVSICETIIQNTGKFVIPNLEGFTNELNTAKGLLNPTEGVSVEAIDYIVATKCLQDLRKSVVVANNTLNINAVSADISSLIPFLNTVSEFNYSFVFKLIESASGKVSLLSMKEGATEQANLYLENLDNPTIGFKGYKAEQNDTFKTAGQYRTTNLVDGNWHVLTVRSSGDNNFETLIDGNTYTLQSGNSSFASKVWLANVDQIKIGGSDFPGVIYKAGFSGSKDESIHTNLNNEITKVTFKDGNEVCAIRTAVGDEVITAPEAPKKEGFTFSHWADSIGNKVTEFNSTMEVTAQYNEGYQLTVQEEGNATGEHVSIEGSEQKSALHAFNTVVTVKANETNGTTAFAGWYLVKGNEKKLVSTKLQYSFAVSDDTTLEAKYSSVKEQLPNAISMENAFVVRDEAGVGTLKYVAKVNIPETTDKTITGVGFLWSGKSAVTEADLTVNTTNANVKKVVLNRISEAGQCSITLKNVPDTKSAKGKFYVTYSDGETVYYSAMALLENVAR